MSKFILTAKSTNMQKALKCSKLSLETLMVSPPDCHVKTDFTAANTNMQKALKCRKLSLKTLIVRPLDCHVKIVLTGSQNEL